MLNLASDTPRRWLAQVDAHLDEVLIDHAHCEKKAAATAMNLLFAYVDDEELCREMSDIVVEELEHFRLVLDLLGQRQIRFRRLKPSSYGRRLHELIRGDEPQRAIDRLLVASLIEARSCERFAQLRDHLANSDAELAEAQAEYPMIRSKEELHYFRLFTENFGSRGAVETVGQWISL